MPSYVVAGASRGIGAAFVEHLAENANNTVFAIARNPDTSEQLQKFKNKSNVHLLKGDLTDAASLHAAADAVAKVTGGSLDVLINNGAVPGNFFATIDGYETPDALVEDFRNVFDTNVIGVISSTNAFLPLLRKGQTKKVLTLGSGIGDSATVLNIGHKYAPAYCISKAALEMVGVKYAVKYKDEGFLFLTICPGAVKTSESSQTTSENPDHNAKLQEIQASFTKLAPTGWTGPVEPPSSVRDMLAVLDRSTPADSGKFVSHHGNRNWL